MHPHYTYTAQTRYILYPICTLRYALYAHAIDALWPHTICTLHALYIHNISPYGPQCTTINAMHMHSVYYTIYTMHTQHGPPWLHFKTFGYFCQKTKLLKVAAGLFGSIRFGPHSIPPDWHPFAPIRSHSTLKNGGPKQKMALGYNNIYIYITPKGLYSN